MRLSREQAAALIEQTEGWFAIVYLNLRSYLQDGHWLDSSESVYAVVDEVLFRPLPPQLSAFLVRMGVPDEFTAPQADWMWPEGGARRVLDALTRQNAFITQSGGVYRYHNMLRDCARVKFAQLPQEEQSRQLKRLGQWYENDGDHFRAEQCFEKSGAWDELLRAIFADKAWSITGENFQRLIYWSSACPEETLKGNPDALLVLMRKLFSFGQIPEMLRLQKLLHSALEERADLSRTEKNNYLGECQLLMSFLAYNDIAAMSTYHRSACALMTRTAVNIDPHGFWTFGAPSVLMMFHRTAGGLDAENAAMAECMPYYYQVTDYHGNGAEYVMKAETHFMRGDFAEAELSGQFAAAAASRRGQFSILVTARFLTMQLLVFSGSFDEAVKELASLRELLRQERQYYLLYTLEAMQAWIYAIAGRLPELPAWLSDEGQTSPLMQPALPMQEIIRNQVLLAQGRFSALAAREAAVSALCGSFNALLCTIWLELQLACAYAGLKKPEEAKRHLSAALELSVPDGLLMPFALCGGYIAPLLRELSGSGQYAGEIEKILALSAQFESAAQLSADTQGLPQDLGLTGQELETAELAAARLSAAEIAERLCLSEKTIKNRLTTIYDKLGITGDVRNKRAALSKLFHSPKAD